jgi:hypothetical protein
VLKEMTENGTLRRDKRKLVVLDRAAVADRTHLSPGRLTTRTYWNCHPA